MQLSLLFAIAIGVWMIALQQVLMTVLVWRGKRRGDRWMNYELEKLDKQVQAEEMAADLIAEVEVNTRNGEEVRAHRYGNRTP